MLALNEYRSKARGLPDLCVYAALIAPGVVLNKNASFTTAWEVKGLDTASSTPDELKHISAQFNQAVKLLGTGFMLHVDAIRSPKIAYSNPEANHFPDPVCQLIDDERRAFFGRGLCYATRTIVSLTYQPNLSADKIAALAQSDAKADPLAKALSHFENVLAEMEDALSAALHMRRLGEYKQIEEDGSVTVFSELLSHLQLCLSGISQPVRVPATPMYLDAILCSEDFIGGIAPRLGDRHVVVVAIDGLPQESWPMMLAALDALPIDYRFSTRFICLDQMDAEKELEYYRKGWQQQVFKFLDKFFPNPNAKPNRDALIMAQDAEDAKLEVQGGYVGGGYYTACVVLIDENPELLQEQARELRRTIQTMGFGCRIESINAVEAWLGTHPGNGHANLRRPLINTLNLADLLPFSTIWVGEEFCPCPFFPPNSPPLMVCTTEGSTPIWVNLHVGDLGHTLIFGPTGAGKSTLLATIAAQFRRYQHAQIFTFDKGMSLYPLCRFAGGSHYEIGKAGALSFAPLQHLDESEAEMAWCHEWVCTMAELQLNRGLNPGERNTVHTALKALAANPREMRSLTDLLLQIQDTGLREALIYYTSSGAMGHLLDASTDTLGISDFMVFEIEDLMNMGEKILLPVLLYIFHRIEKSLHGQPSLIVLDEAWIMLGHDVFRSKIREWLKVLRKANCSIVLATQSITDAARSGILDVLAESCPTKMFLPNIEARQETQQDLYFGLGLNSRQVDIIASATPKRDYYITTPKGRRLIQLALGPKTLAFVGASDKESITRIREIHQEHGPEAYKIWLRERGINNL